MTDSSATLGSLSRALGPKYEVRRLIGSGGFAEVYEVWDQELERRLLERLEPQVNRFVSKPAECAELASRLPDDGLLIEYWRCTWPGEHGAVASYVALVLPKNRPDPASIVHLRESAAVEDTLREYLSLLSRRSKAADFGNVQDVKPDPARARALGQRVRELVLDPLKSWTADAKHLLLVTDGLPEAPTASGDPLGYEAFAELVPALGAESPGDMLDRLFALVREATRPALEDDWTALVLEARAAAGSS